MYFGPINELPLAAIEVRKSTKSTQTTKQDYQWRQWGLRILEEIVVVISARKTRGNLEEKCQLDTKTDKRVAASLKP